MPVVAAADTKPSEETGLDKKSTVTQSDFPDQSHTPHNANQIRSKTYVETIAVMAKYNPFFKKAVMTKIAETTPNPQVLNVVQKLKDPNFSQIFLTSKRTKMNQLQNVTETEVSKVRTVIKEVKGIYRRRVEGTKQAALNKKNMKPLQTPQTPANWLKCFVYQVPNTNQFYLFWKKETKN